MGWSVTSWTPHNRPDHRPAGGKVYCQRSVQKVQVCGTGVLKRGYLSPTQRRIITFYCDLWRLGSRAGSIHSVLTNNSPTQTSSLGLIIAGSGKTLSSLVTYLKAKTFENSKTSFFVKIQHKNVSASYNVLPVKELIFAQSTQLSQSILINDNYAFLMSCFVQTIK